MNIPNFRQIDSENRGLLLLSSDLQYPKYVFNLHDRHFSRGMVYQKSNNQGTFNLRTKYARQKLYICDPEFE